MEGIEIICKPCCMCGERNKVTVFRVDFERWQNDEAYRHVQVAFPYLPADQRELLISGTCPPCFDKLFPEED